MKTNLQSCSHKQGYILPIIFLNMPLIKKHRIQLLKTSVKSIYLPKSSKECKDRLLSFILQTKVIILTQWPAEKVSV